MQKNWPKTATQNPKTFQTKFFVRKNKGSETIPVCQGVFLGILQIKQAPADFVTKNVQRSGSIPKKLGVMIMYP